MRGIRFLQGCSALALTLGASGHAQAQDAATAARLARLEALVQAQSERLERQEEELARLRTPVPEIDDAWRVVVQPPETLANLTARGVQAAPVAPVSPQAQDRPQSAVAAPPVLRQTRSELAALPEGMAVLSGRGRASFDFTADYTRSTANRLVFRGIEIVPGIQIGVIEANEADRDTLSESLIGRYGVTDRLEIEGRVPLVARYDTITTVQQRDQAVTRTIALEGKGLGDVEGAIRYQVNAGAGGRPVYVAALRVKSDTGEGPFDIERDEFGVATRLATGSGFWGVEPSLSMLFASDPAVIFANVSYFAHLPRDVNVTEGDVTVGRVDPGDSIGAAIGFGFALNPKFSFSLGYRHSYIFPTESELNDTVERSDELQVGALLLGLSYRFDERWSVNGNFEFGVTGDAPDVRMVARIPLAF